MTKPQGKQFLNKFGANIASARKRNGVTQQQLAEQVNMSTVAIAYLETGKRWARPETLLKIAAALHIDVSDLFLNL